MSLRVLTLSTLFPDASRPRFAPFVERQTLELAAHPDVDLQVIAPIGLPPWPLSSLARYADLSALPKTEIWKGLRVKRPKFRHWPTQPRFDPANLAASTLPLVADQPIDVIDAEFFWPDGPAAIRLGKTLGVPVSIKARGSDIAYWGERRRRDVLAAADDAAGMLAVSSALRDQMIATGMSADRIGVHYTGVDLDVFAPRDRVAAQQLLGVWGALVGCVANRVEGKGQAILIAAVKALAETTMVFIGQGPARRTLEKLAAEAGVSGRVRFTGALPQAEVARWMAAADAVALASRSEGLANVWVEALACGTPVVTTDVGGAREVLTSADYGRIVPCDASHFADALNDVIANPRDQATIRKGAERFTWGANTAALYDHLKALSLYNPR